MIEKKWIGGSDGDSPGAFYARKTGIGSDARKKVTGEPNQR